MGSPLSHPIFSSKTDVPLPICCQVTQCGTAPRCVCVGAPLPPPQPFNPRQHQGVESVHLFPLSPPDSVLPPPACDPLPTVQPFAQRQMFTDLSYTCHAHIVGQHQGVCVGGPGCGWCMCVIQVWYTLLSDLVQAHCCVGVNEEEVIERYRSHWSSTTINNLYPGRFDP